LLQKVIIIIILIIMSEPKSQEDLDLFLTGVESKLRGPFSSLDLAKAISTTALRGSHTPSEYLQLISKVLSRTDKVIQLRILVGLLGLDSTRDTTDDIYNVLQQAQDADRHEEWVRTVSGLIQGIMFQQQQHEDEQQQQQREGGGGSSSRESCRGDMAKELLQKTCLEIIERVREVDRDKAQHIQSTFSNKSNSGNNKDNDVDDDDEDDGEVSEPAVAGTDMNAYFAPYSYSLLPRELVKQVIPECSSNPHFRTSTTSKASILSIDDQLELEKATEAAQHKPAVASSTHANGSGKKNGGESSSSAAGAAGVDISKHQYPPGFRPSKVATSKSKLAGTHKSSMFMPAKKPTLTTTMTTTRPMSTTMGAGGARPTPLGAASTTSTATTTTGPTGAVAGGTSGPGLAAGSKQLLPTSITTAGIHVRRKGGAQALLSKGGFKQRVAGKVGTAAASAGGASGSGTAAASSFLAARKMGGANGSSGRGASSGSGLVAAGRSGRSMTNSGSSNSGPGANRSKMKMIDVNEVDTLAKEHQERDEKLAQQEKHKSRKRKIMDMAAEKGLVGNTAKSKRVEPAAATTTTTTPATATVSGKREAKESASKSTEQHPAPPASTAAPAEAAALAPATEPFATDPAISSSSRQSEWEALLNERSNKLSGEDRFRVQQFFDNRFNPTPEQSTYKMKLHEARTTDPQSGQAIKETFYLELDYQTFTSKQSKKVKRY
jgi:hypothetical protein